MKRQLTHLECLENERLVPLSKEDETIINLYLEKGIELVFDDNDESVYTESGKYVADLREY